jgi:nucleoside-diphosphate-sugar epimerase
VTTELPKVLLTGGAGLIGSIMVNSLSDEYEFSSFDLKEAEGIRSIVGNLDDLSAVEEAVAGHDAVVHLAADTRVSADWESTLKNNFISTYNVFEASKQMGVKRVILLPARSTPPGDSTSMSRGSTL